MHHHCMDWASEHEERGMHAAPREKSHDYTQAGGTSGRHRRAAQADGTGRRHTHTRTKVFGEEIKFVFGHLNDLLDLSVAGCLLEHLHLEQLVQCCVLRLVPFRGIR